MKKEIKIKAVRSGAIVEKKDVVVVEKNVEMVLNGRTRISISISPEDLVAFTYGFLFTSGFITSKQDIKKININKSQSKIGVKLTNKRDLGHILSLGSSGGRHIEFAMGKEPFKEKLTLDFEKLFSLFGEFMNQSVIFSETGGVHSAAISDGVSIKFFSEDIGRHNAVDKVIGKAFLKKINFPSHFLFLSGRISSEIVKKSFNAGIRTIVSRSAPTSMAVSKAQKNNMTIIGFLRGDRFNIYT